MATEAQYTAYIGKLAAMNIDDLLFQFAQAHANDDYGSHQRQIKMIRDEIASRVR